MQRHTTEKPVLVRLGSALGQSRIVRDAPAVQITTGKPLTKQSREKADNQATRSMDAIVSLSRSHLGQAHHEPKVTREPVAACRKRISRDAENNWMVHFVSVRENISHAKDEDAESASTQ